MKYGTIVTIERGSERQPLGQPGCLRKVKGKYLGSQGCNVMVRLLEDDPLDTVGWSKAGDIGWWSKSIVKPYLKINNKEWVYNKKI